MLLAQIALPFQRISAWTFTEDKRCPISHRYYR